MDNSEQPVEVTQARECLAAHIAVDHPDLAEDIRAGRKDTPLLLRTLDAMRAYADRLSHREIPPGHVIVPVDATVEMNIAGMVAFAEADDVSEIWSAMINAIPKQG